MSDCQRSNCGATTAEGEAIRMCVSSGPLPAIPSGRYRAEGPAILFVSFCSTAF